VIVFSVNSIAILEDNMPRRRAFLAQLTTAAAALAFDADELRAASSRSAGAWDTSWLDKLKSPQFRVVFNASDIADGVVTDYVSSFLDGFHDVHGTSDSDTRPVIVFRRNGTGMAFNDAMWDKYNIGEYANVKDSATNAAARRNIFWRAAGPKPSYTSPKLEDLTARGLISLVCNVAANGYGRGLAEQNKLDAAAVQADLKANLIPGALLVPSGIYALIRAQNAGCAFMQGT
jgi:intracellular sulfur oxidation DsrE/DsrF family protein